MNIELTQHVKDQLQKRKIGDYELFHALKYPDKTLKKYGKYYFQKMLDRGCIETVCEKTENHIKVITVYWL